MQTPPQKELRQVRFPDSSLRARFTFSFAISVLVLSIGLGAYVERLATEQVRNEIGLSLADAAQQMASKLDQDIWSRSMEIKVLASMMALVDNRESGHVRSVLNQLQNAVPEYAFIGLTNEDGTVVASAGKLLENMSIASRPVFLLGLQGLFVGDVHEALMLAKLIPNPSGEPVKFVDISAPVLDESGKLTGVLATHLSWDWARQVRESLLATLQWRHDIDLLVVSSDDTILLGPKESIGMKLNLDILNKARKNQRAWEVVTWPDGNTYVTGACYSSGYSYGESRFEGLGWTVLAREPKVIAFAQATELSNRILTGGFIASVLFAIWGFAVAKHVSKPLKEITEAARRVSNGEDVPIPAGSSITDIASLETSLRDMLHNLTRSEAARNRMEILATRDRLTGLLNRLGLEQYLETSLPRIHRTEQALAVFCLDLDGFKQVNDTLGHPAGDALLKEIGKRLHACLRGEDVVARFGGDEFIVLLEGDPDTEHGMWLAVADRIIQSVNTPIDLDGNQVRVGVSLGGAVWPRDGELFKDVMHLADKELYRIKRSGKNRLSMYRAV